MILWNITQNFPNGTPFWLQFVLPTERNDCFGFVKDVEDCRLQPKSHCQKP